MPFAGPFIQPATAAILAADYPDLTILTTHHNAASTAEMAVTLLLATAKQVELEEEGMTLSPTDPAGRRLPAEG